jgi:hypothetical protein
VHGVHERQQLRDHSRLHWRSHSLVGPPSTQHVDLVQEHDHEGGVAAAAAVTVQCFAKHLAKALLCYTDAGRQYLREDDTEGSRVNHARSQHG